MIRTSTAIEISLQIEVFASSTIESLITAPVSVIWIQPRKKGRHRVSVDGGSGAHKRVDADVEEFTERLKTRRVLIDQLLDRNAASSRGGDVLERVLIGAGLEAYGSPAPALEARHDVRLYELECEADMRGGIDVGDGRREAQ
jgi:hypothetical protein